jgi:hypothetical protein
MPEIFSGPETPISRSIAALEANTLRMEALRQRDYAGDLPTVGEYAAVIGESMSLWSDYKATLRGRG